MVLRDGTENEYDPVLAIGFDLVTAKYYEADGTHIVAEEDDDVDSDWESKIAWNNYGSCWMGMSQSSSSPGIIVSDGTVPFDFRLPEYSFEADPLPINWDNYFDCQTFGTYLLGHDAVADHRIHLHNRQGDDTYTLEWGGRIALAYGGETEFKYNFNAIVSGVALDAISLWAFDRTIARDYYGIDLDVSLTPEAYLAPFVKAPERFSFEKRNGTLYAVPKTNI
ncbi:hypothetical protein AB4Y96_09375 [Phyllobacterium sp. TAF24]|uniref:hypothetical protein n=1 Tax=Phyllobacterium sp. TAF24 TaxID=3233068 RepID=UPI003F94CB84